MSDNKMTIHRALAELKLIDARIEKGIGEIEPTGIQVKGKLVNGAHDRESFENEAKSKFQSVTDLIERKLKIKSAIVKANAETMITVAGKSMTIADAINYKQIVGVRRMLANTLLNKHKSKETTMEHNNAKIESNALQLAGAALQKDNVKIGDNDAVAITKPYIEANEFHLVDPLGVRSKADKIIEEVEKFEVEIDATLSEINATTFIEIV